MSRVGKKPILIPENVEVKIKNSKILVKGPKGELSQEIRPEIRLEIKNNQILISPKIETKRTRAFWGLSRALVANLIKGVTEGFEKKLEIEGLGYKALLEGENLVISCGFSHPVKVKIPEDIKISVEKNIITVSGSDKQLVGQTAARIKRVSPPEPYKGKGIKYFGEKIRRKVGKKAVTAAG
jgi:large subunit ribosomal protein L6